MGKKWLTGKDLKTKSPGDFVDAKFYPVDDETKEVDWELYHKLHDIKMVPTYDDILKEFDISENDILIYNGETPSYLDLLKLYAMKRRLDVNMYISAINDPSSNPLPEATEAPSEEEVLEPVYGEEVPFVEEQTPNKESSPNSESTKEE